MIVHFDVWGPSRVGSISSHRWLLFLLLLSTDMVYLMHHKSDVFSCFKMFHKMVATLFYSKARILRSKWRRIHGW